MKTDPTYATRTVDVVKRDVIDTIKIGENGTVDVLDHLARIAMNDAREYMTSENSTETTYEVDDGDLGKTSITIQHTPTTNATVHMTVAEAKTALREAQRRERDDYAEEPVPAA